MRFSPWAHWSGLRRIQLSILTLVLFFTAVTSAPSVHAQTSVNVNIHNFSFSPASITLVIGVNNTVVWTNNDSVTHTVTAYDNSFNSSSINAGKTFSHTFTSTGTYTYHCSIHTYMKGTIKVLGGPTSTTTSASSQPSSSSGSSSNGVSAFPYQPIVVALVATLVALSYLAIRRREIVSS